MKGTRKVMLVTHSLADGGTDRVAVHLANGISKERPVFLYQAALTCDPKISVANMLNKSVKHICARKNTIGRTRDLISTLPNIIKTINRENPDYIISTGNNNSLYTTIAHLLTIKKKRKLCIKITNPVNRTRGNFFNKKIRSWLYKVTFKSADQIWVLSESEKSILSNDFPKSSHKISIVKNPYISDIIINTNALRKKNNKSLNKKKIAINIGRIHFQKNIPLLINSWKILIDTWQDKENFPVLWLLGDGPDKMKIIDQISSLNLNEHIVLKGYQPDITFYLEQADIMVLSSDYEGLPAVVLESLATGMPVVSTNSFPAAKEILSDTQGCAVVPVGDAKALADAIYEALQSDRYQDALVKRALPYRIDDAVKSHLMRLD